MTAIGGVTTQVGLTIKDYVGEGVSGMVRLTVCPFLINICIELAVNNFNALPGCYAASVPRIIAGYWYVCLFSLVIFVSLEPLKCRITPVIVESED
jgi:hypothetical protein